MSLLGNYKYPKKIKIRKDLREANKIDKKIMKDFKKNFKTKYSLLYKQPKTLNNIIRMISYLNTDDDSFKEQVFTKINQLQEIEYSSNLSSSESDLDQTPRERKSKKIARSAIYLKSRRNNLRTKRNRSNSSNSFRMNKSESSSSGKRKTKKARSKSPSNN